MPTGDQAEELDRRLAQVEALRKRVLNVIPHALRTPITTFRGLAEALPNASEAEIREQLTPALRRLAAQAEHLVDDLLIASGYTTALPTSAMAAHPVVATVRQVWEEVGTGLPLDVEGDEAVTASAPEGNLFKILVHVLDNAAKYGEAPHSVRVGAVGERVKIEVTTGGPTPADAPMFFEPFYRGEKAVMRSSGLGLGLTVAQVLAEQAGGSMNLECPADGGITTHIELAAG